MGLRSLRSLFGIRLCVADGRLAGGERSSFEGAGDWSRHDVVDH
jgi:hypothetical protein